MLEILCQEHYDKVVEFAKKTNQWEGENGLKKELDWLDTYAYTEDSPSHTKCELFYDSAPHSFFFQMYRKLRTETEWKQGFCGGLIHHGVHDNGGDGSAPTFSVNLTPVHGWSIHT